MVSHPPTCFEIDEFTVHEVERTEWRQSLCNSYNIVVLATGFQPPAQAESAQSAAAQRKRAGSTLMVSSLPRHTGIQAVHAVCPRMTHLSAVRCRAFALSESIGMRSEQRLVSSAITVSSAGPVAEQLLVIVKLVNFVMLLRACRP